MTTSARALRLLCTFSADASPAIAPDLHQAAAQLDAPDLSPALLQLLAGEVASLLARAGAAPYEAETARRLAMA